MKIVSGVCVKHFQVTPRHRIRWAHGNIQNLCWKQFFCENMGVLIKWQVSFDWNMHIQRWILVKCLKCEEKVDWTANSAQCPSAENCKSHSCSRFFKNDTRKPRWHGQTEMTVAVSVHSFSMNIMFEFDPTKVVVYARHAWILPVASHFSICAVILLAMNPIFLLICFFDAGFLTWNNIASMLPHTPSVSVFPRCSYIWSICFVSHSLPQHVSDCQIFVVKTR